MGRSLVYAKTTRVRDDVTVMLKIAVEGEKPLAFTVGHVVRDDRDASKTMWMTTTHRVGHNPDVVTRGHPTISDAARCLLHAWVNSMALHETDVSERGEGAHVGLAPVSDWLAGI